MKKRILALVMAVVMIAGTVAMAAGTEKSITVTPMTLSVNGLEVTPTKSNGAAAEIFSYDGATYAPLRYLSELLGVTVEWDKSAPGVAKLTGVSGMPTAPAASFTPGVYTGTAQGRNGPVTVEVTFEADRIAAVSVTAHTETVGISDGAIAQIPAAIVNKQSLSVDTVASATITSEAILAAVEDCVKQAGASADELKAEADTSAPLVPGIYEGSARSYMGDVTVHVTVDETGIRKVDVVSCTDMPENVQRAAVAVVPGRIVAAQSTKVDGVSGATFTSNAIKAATAQALGKAGNAARFAVDVAKTAPTKGKDEAVDVLVLGGGGSGVMAALYAQNKDLIGADTGLKVMLVEKQGFLGGSIMLSGGYIGAAMPLGDDTLLNDPAVMKSFVDGKQMAGRPEVNRNLLERYARMSNVEPLSMQKLGMPLMTAKSTLAPSSYSGLVGWDLLTHDFADPAADGWTQAGDYLGTWFEHRLAQTNVDVRLNTTADELVVENGAVVGAVVHDAEHTYTVRAKKVIDACGSLISNPEMFAKYYPSAAGSPIYANGGNTGDGLRMVTEKFGVEPTIGRLMDGYFAVDYIWGEDNDLREGLFNTGESMFIVNKAGKRVVYDAKGYKAHAVCDAIYEEPGKVLYVIVDGTHPCVANIEASRHQDVIVRGETLDAVANQLGIDAAALKQTVDTYNAVKNGQGVDEFGVAAEDMISLEKGTFYGLPIYSVQTATFSGFIAGDNCEILDSDGRPIPNLYGCGETLYGFASVSGALATGAIAGTVAADSILGK